MEILGSALYERRLFIMGKSKDKKGNTGTGKGYISQIVVSVLSELILTIIIICVGKISGFLALPDLVNDIDDRVKALEEAKNDLPDDTKKSTTIETNTDGTATVIITGKGNLPFKTEEGYVEPEYRMSDPANVLNNTTDSKTGERYALNQLTNQKIIVSFKDGNRENYFYGKYNENDHWDGECITNIYEDDKLLFIMEAEYKDGNLISYTQAFKGETFKEKDVWSIAERKCVMDQKTKKRYNTGETWNYFYVDYIKQFDMDNVNSSNIKYVDNLRKELQSSSSLEGYYHGNTADGLYNDSTGNAYMLKYSEDGFIRALYVGIFRDGSLNDKQGWEIVFDKSNNINKYFYYEGPFEGGYRKESVDRNPYITQDDIDRYIYGMTFNCDLEWYDPSRHSISNNE